MAYNYFGNPYGPGGTVARPTGPRPQNLTRRPGVPIRPIPPGTRPSEMTLPSGGGWPWPSPGGWPQLPPGWYTPREPFRWTDERGKVHTGSRPGEPRPPITGFGGFPNFGGFGGGFGNLPPVGAFGFGGASGGLGQYAPPFGTGGYGGYGMPNPGAVRQTRPGWYRDLAEGIGLAVEPPSQPGQPPMGGWRPTRGSY